jgi:hypothetical protein
MPSPLHLKDKWNQSTVRSILTNEKYKGDALLQKSYTVDFLTKKTKTNEGEVPQYYVENNHDYNKRYNALVKRYDRLKAQYDEVSTAISDNEARYEQMGRFITVLKDQEGVITEFDDALWSSLVEKIVVKSKEDVMMVFKDGTEMKAE